MIDLLLDPKIWMLVLFLSVLGSFARLPNYYLGQHGKEKIIAIYPRVRPETWDRVIQYYKQLDRLPLLLSSIPIIGTVLTIGAGMAGFSRNAFLFWVAVSKIIRNWILVMVIWLLL